MAHSFDLEHKLNELKLIATLKVGSQIVRPSPTVYDFAECPPKLIHERSLADGVVIQPFILSLLQPQAHVALGTVLRYSHPPLLLTSGSSNVTRCGCSTSIYAHKIVESTGADTGWPPQPLPSPIDGYSHCTRRSLTPRTRK